MAAEARWTDHPLARTLMSGARRYSFFKAVHLLQACFPQAVRVGGQGPVEEECLRFRTDLSLGFPSSDVTEIRPLDRGDGAGPRYEVTTTFLGLYGPSSPLPAFYTEDLLEQDPDESLCRKFLDLFHHRAISLFYRTWEKYRYSMQFRKGGADEHSKRLLDLIGLDRAVLPEHPRIPPVRLLAYAGLLTQQPRSASALRGILADYFEGIPVEIEECVGQRLEISKLDQNRLGLENCRLGTNLAIGERIPDRSATFRVLMGPVTLEVFMTLLPPGENMARARELIDLFNADGLDYEMEVRLRRDEVPSLRLSGPTALLGWSSWLGDRPGSDQFVRFLMKGKLHGQR